MLAGADPGAQPVMPPLGAKPSKPPGTAATQTSAAAQHELDSPEAQSDEEVLEDSLDEALAPETRSHTPATFVPTFPPCDPVSELIRPSGPLEPSPQFCKQWNPDFKVNGSKCCGRVGRTRKKRRQGKCGQPRGHHYCDDLTPEQRAYLAENGEGKTTDILALLTREMGKWDQAYCTPNNGFLFRGRPIISRSDNRIAIRSPDRCLYFGTDAMAAMIEWLGREVKGRYGSPADSDVKLILGNLSAPRGGCLAGRSGRRGHASHTNGQDADLGFITTLKSELASNRLPTTFVPNHNWWLIKKIFNNPYACIKVVFLDRKHIKRLAKEAKKDPEWKAIQKFIKHAVGHKNHMHVRIGRGPGQIGCVPGAKPEEEVEEDYEEIEGPDDGEILNQIHSEVPQNKVEN